MDFGGLVGAKATEVKQGALYFSGYCFQTDRKCDCPVGECCQ